MLSRFRALVFASLLICAGLSAFAQGLPDDLPNAQRIRAYVQAFNSGDDAMTVFLKENLAEVALQSRSVAERLDIYRQTHGRLKTLVMVDVPNVEVSGETQAVTVHMKSGDGDVNVTFNFDPKPPNKLLALQIEEVVGHGPKASPRDGMQGGTEVLPPMSEAEFVQKLSSSLDDATKKDEFSGAVLVARNGKTIFDKAYGFADRDKKIPNNVETKFNLGSINKIFTRIAIGQLVSAGTLAYTDKLGKWLPNYPNADAREKVTIAQLVTMRSGIGDFFGEKYQATPKSKLRTLADYLPLFADQPLLFEPGTSSRYSNGGYVVLGLIIEKASGLDYYKYVKEHIFDVAGMKETESYFTDQKVGNRAEGYTKEEAPADTRRNNESSRPWRGSSAGGGYSTASDLLKFTQALASGKLVMLSSETGKPELGGVGIAGGAPGINAALDFESKSGNTVIVLSNLDPPTAVAKAMEIRNWMKSVK